MPKTVLEEKAFRYATEVKRLIHKMPPLDMVRKSDYSNAEFAELLELTNRIYTVTKDFLKERKD